LLYDAKAQADESVTYEDVRDRIVETEGSAKTSYGRTLAGLANFYDALDGWGINDE
jgi:hypothetical protein